MMPTAIALIQDVPDFLEILAKLGLSALLGGVIGWERERAGRPAGVRTHMLIVLGCTLFTELSAQFGSGTDNSRVAAQIVTGVGFLGAGAIMRRGGEIRGLTTAASVWISAAIGMAVGVGGEYYLIAVAATLLALLTLGVVDVLTDRAFGNRAHCDLEVTLQVGAPAASVFALLEESGIELMRSQRSSRHDGAVLDLTLAGSRADLHSVIDRLAALPEVKSVVRDHA
ncbi:MAG: MgtC/SapB family protein [Fimbriimonadia bacterium]|jgi:putative Mg2+ transporter-C (MgtC) family protein